MLRTNAKDPVATGRAGKHIGQARGCRGRSAWACMLLTLALVGSASGAQTAEAPGTHSADRTSTLKTTEKPRQRPPRVLSAERFLAARGVMPGHRVQLGALVRQQVGAVVGTRPMAAQSAAISTQSGGETTWQALGPAAVITPAFGLVTGRITAIALDPSDVTGNHVYLGTTGGGVWSSSNAGTVADVIFSPLTDMVTALGGAVDASVSVGALTVQPGGTGVVLAGTGDPNDVLDSYYGAGILRSTDGGTTWSLIAQTEDAEAGYSASDFSFAGEGFAGFAWSTVNPQVVVAAVSSSYEGEVVDAGLPTMNSEGLFYSTDSGATWHLATISDGSGAVVQSASVPLLGLNGNAATAVVWNPVRRLFLAAVRFHGYYSSPDGETWTRLANQPGAGLTTVLCPTNAQLPGDVACPVYRGALAVNPVTGDSFAWTVDLDNQDQGLWQDKCAISGGSCSNSSITFAQQWNTGALESSTGQGAATIADGDYNLTLAAIPQSQDTLVLAGAHDLWKCSLAMGCVWRNTTNSTSCMSAQVGEYQHALGWNASNPEEIFVGNDSGLWRSTDGIGETGAVCSATDAEHFQNLNGGLGSLAEVESLSPIPTTPYAILAGLGVNGTAGVKATAVTSDWPQILSGYGGPVAIDPRNANNWFVNDQPGVAIYQCSQTAPCTPSAFGSSPIVTDADVSGDGDAMPVPAAFQVDPLNSNDLLVATCRVWRGETGTAWGGSNAISPILSNQSAGGPCNGNALIRAMAAMPLNSGGEMIYVGMYGSATNGSLLPGHVLSAVYDPSSGAIPTWNDLTLNPVTNDSRALNYFGLDISSIAIDPHDVTGKTVYVTVEGMQNFAQPIQVVYRSTDGGATWSTIVSNLPRVPVSGVAIDPGNANTVYVATDIGVYFTAQAGSCAQSGSACWAAFGTGLPEAPAVALSTSPAGSSAPVLVAATYGRGIWETPLFTANAALAAASVSPAWLTFASQAFNATSPAQTVTVFNTGNAALTPTSIVFSGDFNESTDNCTGQTIAPGSSCMVSVTFTPQATGPRSGAMTIYANVYGGQIAVDLNGTGGGASAVNLTPAAENFGQEEEGKISAPLSITVANGGAATPVGSIAVTAPFVVPAGGNACGAGSLVANSDCQIQVEFAPTATGTFVGTLTLTDGAGVQTVQLTGTGVAPPTDIVNPASLGFPATSEGAASTAMPVTITNVGGEALTGIAISVTGEYEQTNNCSSQLAAGAVCTIEVAFVPTQTGAQSGTLTISDALKTQTVALSGTGVTPPVFGISPQSLTFANQKPGSASAPQTVTVTNTGVSAMANIGFAFSGAAASSYTVASTTCGAMLKGGASCTALVEFTPEGTGAIAAMLAVSSSTPGVAAAAVTLNGSAQLASGLTISPAQLDFQVVAMGQTSAAQTVTISNSTGYTIGAVSLAAAMPFSVTQTNCAGSLAAGATCTAGVVFAPTAGGAADGTLTVSSNDVGAPAVAGLQGSGFGFTVAFSGASSQSVVRGQTADYTLVISPAGASGSFSLNCGTLPSDALCLFNPTTETLNAGVQGNVQVQVSTNGPQARLEGPGNERPRGERSGPWQALPLACGALLLPLAIFRRRTMLQLALLLAMLAWGMSSCTSAGGGNGNTVGAGGGTGTPTGTYTIPVAVSANGMSQSVDLVLTVD